MLSQIAKGNGVTLTLERVSAASPSGIELSSPAFSEGGKIPETFSEYGDKVSPPLQWKSVSGAKSYVLIVEDPDAATAKPVVHWVAWNIAGDLGAVPQGLQKQPRLTEPEGILQGKNTHGSIGYFGPRPPVGDPDHHYHFQILALDKKLDVLPGSDRDTVLEAAKGSVIAKGELVGVFSQSTETQ
jgi:Raf kinase inhibitor-like YbhB/YbcL family protein